MKKRTLRIRGMEIGGSRSCICVPVTAEKEEELTQMLGSLEGHEWDMLEWRADYYSGLERKEDLIKPLRKIRASIGEKPLLFTYRTRKEGGRGTALGSRYRELLLGAAASSAADLVDVELFTAGENAQVLTGELHLLGTPVVGSSHDFEKTPSTEEMLARLCRMQELGMDITKLAVMPKSRLDVIRLLEAAVRMEEELGDRPCVTMAMGASGVLTRVSETLTGNAITFGTCGRASAPGQIPADQMYAILGGLRGEG